MDSLRNRLKLISKINLPYFRCKLVSICNTLKPYCDRKPFKISKNHLVHKFQDFKLINQPTLHCRHSKTRHCLIPLQFLYFSSGHTDANVCCTPSFQAKSDSGTIWYPWRIKFSPFDHVCGTLCMALSHIYYIQYAQQPFFIS